MTNIPSSFVEFEMYKSFRCRFCFLVYLFKKVSIKRLRTIKSETDLSFAILVYYFLFSLSFTLIQKASVFDFVVCSLFEKFPLHPVVTNTIYICQLSEWA